MTRAFREALQTYFETLTPNVSFQPPSNVKLSYPCIVYQRQSYFSTHANNTQYMGRYVYQVTVIDKDPESEIPEQILKTMSMSSLSSVFTIDNLHHTVITIY